MSAKREYGWDDHADEGIAELRRMLNSRTFAPLDAQRHLLQRFIEIYTHENEGTLEARSLYPEDARCKAQKKASKNIRALKVTMEEYYQAEGKDSSIRIGFAADKRKYRIAVTPHEPAPASLTPPETVPGDHTIPGACIRYREEVTGTFVMPPLLWPILCFVSGVAGLFLMITALSTAAKVMDHHGSVIWTVILIGAAVFLFLAMRTSYRVHTVNFGHFVGPLFVRRDGRTVALASYTAPCPFCGEKVGLTYRKKARGYTGECRKNSEQHRFSFDFINMEGVRLS